MIETNNAPRGADLIADLFGGSIMHAFACMEIAGEECEAYERDHGKGAVSSELWGLLCPGELFAGVTEAVYRSHVRELLGRGGRGLDVATDAELLIGMRTASLATPLNRSGTMVYHHLFRSVLGDDVYRSVLADVDPPRERWEGELADALADARRGLRGKLSRPARLEDAR